MKIAVDAEKCQEHARCYALSPALFNVDDYGQSTVNGDGTVPTDLEDKPNSRSRTAPSTRSRSPTTNPPLQPAHHDRERR